MEATGAPEKDRFVPAAGRKNLQAIYDPVVSLTMREDRFRSELVDLVFAGSPSPNPVVADVGAGTGTLAITLAGRGAEVHAFDGDPHALNTARAKDGAVGVVFTEALAGNLPLADASVDAVVMSLLLHHLSPTAKDEALAEARRVLRPSGHIHIADWGKPGDRLMRASFFALQLIDGFVNTKEHAEGKLHSRIEKAGFSGLVVHDRLRTAWGLLEIMSADA